MSVEWLAQASDVAEQTLNEDKSNEYQILEFWDFNETALALIQTLKDTVAHSVNGQVDPEDFIQAAQNNLILSVTEDKFSFDQIQTISKSAYPSYLFALHVLKSRFLEGEEAIQRHPMLWGEYEWLVKHSNL